MKRTVLVEIIRCTSCSKLGVTIDNHRITSHKCGGSWRVVHSENVRTDEIDKATRLASKGGAL